jgi:poly [ADP-ribose] polymerase 2/3/4
MLLKKLFGVACPLCVKRGGYEIQLGPGTRVPTSEASKKTHFTLSCLGAGTTTSPVGSFPAVSNVRESVTEHLDFTPTWGDVDPECCVEGGDIVDLDGVTCNVATLDPESLESFILQLVVKTGDQASYYVVYSRRGPMAREQEYEDLESAAHRFFDLFHEETDLEWKYIDEAAPGAGKYHFVIKDSAQNWNGYVGPKWQYWVDDGIDGKDNGWYDYDDTGSRQVESGFSQWTGASALSRHVVTSGRSYEVDLAAMTQTNTATKTARRIRRCIQGIAMPRKKKRTGLKTTVSRVDTVDRIVGVVDTECSVAGVIVDLDGAPCDVMLALVDPAKNIDKYYILQLILKEKDSDHADDTYVVYTRWGRTGTSGQALEQEYKDLTRATKRFTDKFHQKTDLEWQQRHQELAGGNKYRFVTQDFDLKKIGYIGAKWQYWVDDGVDGKSTGWYDCEDAGSREVERLFAEHSGTSGLATRIVEGGRFSYKVDLVMMTQTNTRTKTVRRLRRRIGRALSIHADTPMSTTKNALPPAAPVADSSPTAPISPQIASNTDTASRAVGVIDPGCNVAGAIVNLDGAPCDVMLALVDPAKDFDKFFVLQLILKEKDFDQADDVYAVFARWGRTGTSGQVLQQEFEDLESATKCFTDKFREKTDLEWEDRHEELAGGDKYRFVTQKFDQKKTGYTEAKWQYWVDDGVDGKTTGWYDYDESGSRLVNRLFSEHSGTSGLDTRIVASGRYSYAIDLVVMTQTNTSTKTARRIRCRAEGSNHKNQAVTTTMTPATAASATTTQKTTAATQPLVTPAARSSTSAPPATNQQTASTADTGNEVSGVIDPECTVAGVIVNLDGVPSDVMLALVDPAKDFDKFFILQLILKEKDVACTDDAYVVYTRWGRTGTLGQALQQEFEDLESATKCFMDKFREKTDLEWEDRHEELAGGDKYRFVTQNFDQKKTGYTEAKWQYWVDDGVDGKTTGWYDYDDPGSQQVERLFTEHSGSSGLDTRIVASGRYSYAVDLVVMKQTNTSTKTARRIRRHCERSQKNDESQVIATTTAVATASSTDLVTNVPVLTTSANASNTTAGYSMTQKSKSPPVDSDIAVVDKNPSDYKVVEVDDQDTWHDCVLNQCNIGNNNNKYYRIQMLEDHLGAHFVWCKWGRVGEAARASTSAWLGPFDSKSSAGIVFNKTYKDKTGNAFGSPSFVRKSGRYVPVEVDSNVAVDGRTLTKTTSTEIEYMDSVLDPTTKELVEVLFSKEMRSEALTSFNLDLKRLPLGVPSKAQIQHGISILREIEDKLKGPDAVSESFEELSSRFYTAIPHSFGRSVPPLIDTSTSLQGRYDMCNILLDMFETTETVNRIEAENKLAAKARAPNPIDQYYQSMKAELSLVKSGSTEDTTIRQYFEETKSSHSSAQLLNIWSVARQAEPERFAVFDNLDNRHLLWHGTNIAVVAPIVTSGLRIMPNAGGRVGAGIYLASMQEKSAQYTSGYGGKFACMFLCEAPLGKQHLIYQDESELRSAPDGFDSVRAVGVLQPQSKVTMKIDDKDVIVPASKAAKTSVSSSFPHDEFLVYNEAQVRLRYILTVKL